MDASSAELSGFPEAIAELTSIIDSDGNLAEALEAVRRSPFLAADYAIHEQDIADAINRGDADTLKSILHGIVKQASLRYADFPPQMKREADETANGSVPPAETRRKLAQEFEAALATKEQDAALRGKYRKNLVDTYVAQLRKQGRSPAAIDRMRQTLTEQIDALPAAATITGEHGDLAVFSRHISSLIAADGELAPAVASPSTEQAVGKTIASIDSAERDFTVALMRSPKPAVTADHITHRSAGVDITDATTRDRVIREAHAQAVADIIMTGDPSLRSEAASHAATDLPQAMARTAGQTALGDALTVFGSDAILSRAFSSAIRSVQLQAVEANIDRLGADIVGSPVFAQLLSESQRAGLQRGNQSPLAALTGGVTNFVGDITGSVFRAPMEEAVVSYVRYIGSHPGKTASLSDLYAVSLGIQNFSFPAFPSLGSLGSIGSSLSPSLSSALGFNFDIGGLLSFGARRAATTAAGATAKAATGAATKAAVAGGTKLVAGTVLGGPVGTVVAAVAGSKVGETILGAVSAAAKFLSGSWLGGAYEYLFSGGKSGTQPSSFWLLILAPLLLVVVVSMGAIAPIVPWLNGFTQTTQHTYVRDAALADSMKGENADLETSQYMNVTKTANVSSLTNAQLPARITYTVTITATTAQLENILVWNTTTVIGEKVLTIENDVNGKSIRNLTVSPTSLAPGQTATVTYEVEVNAPNSVVSDSIVVTATVNNTTERAAAVATVTIGSPPTGGDFTCTDGGSKYVAPGAEEHMLIGEGRTRWCIEPSMIVIHWSGGWANAQGNQATYNTLVARGLSCQFATDTNSLWQMLLMWTKKVELAYCVGGNYNNYAINNEIAGAYFDNDPHVEGRYPSDHEIDMAVSNTCAVMKQYNIPASQIFGHMDLISGKPDPGRKFLEMFKGRVRSQCGETGN